MWQTLSTLATSLRAARAASEADCNCSVKNAEMQSHKAGNMLPSTDTARRCRCHTEITTNKSRITQSNNRNSRNSSSPSSNNHSHGSCNYSSNMLQFLLLFGVLCDAGQASLRDVNLLVQPPVVRRGQSVALLCDYQLDGAPLYSIKFYRGQFEFYRYTPGEYPHTKVFHHPSIRVDVSLLLFSGFGEAVFCGYMTIEISSQETGSNSTMVLIRNVSFSLSGPFSCEVTADAPLYSTAMAYAQMQVAEFPDKRPQLFTENTRYEPGDVLRANCSISPSRPRAELRFTINNVPVNSDETQYIRTDDHLIASRLSLRVQLQAIHFVTGLSAHGNGNGNGNGLTNSLFMGSGGGGSSGGGLVLRCTAQIGDLYQEYKEIELGTPQKDPVPARVTLSSGTGLSSFLDYFAKSSAPSQGRGVPVVLGVVCGLVTMLSLLINGS
ncbi:hypothetical protein KR067_005011 [Drosophila pandora]|nr:hypothetical protein KR067_005011 [Drosophila pandora]